MMAADLHGDVGLAVLGHRDGFAIAVRFGHRGRTVIVPPFTRLSRSARFPSYVGESFATK